MDERSLDVQRALAQSEGEQGDAPRFGISKKGGLSYIVDSDGNEVSDGYHEFQVFRAEDGDATIAAIVGRIGGVKYVLKPPTSEGGRFEKATDSYHDLAYRPDLGGLFLTQLGAKWCIVDPETGQKISDGYHDIYKRDGVIYGERGTKVEEIKITKKLPAKIDLALEP